MKRSKIHKYSKDHKKKEYGYCNRCGSEVLNDDFIISEDPTGALREMKVCKNCFNKIKKELKK